MAAGLRLLLVAEGIWLFLVLALPSAVNPWGALAFAPTKAGLLRALALLMLAAWIAGRLAGGGRGGVGQAPLIRAGALYLAVLSLSSALSLQPLISVFGSYDRGTGLLTVAAGFSMALVAADLFKDARRRERAVVAIVLGGAIPSLYGFIQYLGLDPFNWTGVRGILSTLGSPTPLGGYLVMVSPLALYAAGAGARGIAASDPPGALAVLRYAALLSVVLLAPLVAVVASIRGVFLGLAVGFAAQAVASGAGARGPGEGLGRHGRLLSVLAVAAVGGVALVAVTLAPTVPVLVRFTDVGNPSGSAVERLVVWRASAELLLADPPRMLMGFGPDTQAAVFERSEAIVHLGQRDRWDRAHNLLLDAWVTSGLLGVGTLVLLLWVAVRRAWSCATERSSSMQERALAAALLGALVAHVVEASFAFQSVTTGTIFWAVLGLIASLRAVPEPVPATRPRRAWAIAPVAVGLLLVPIAAAPALADALQGAADAAARRGRNEESAELADRAAVAAFWAEEPPRVAALALQARAGALRDAARVERLFATAETRFQEAASRDPYDPFAHLRLVRHYVVRSERAANSEGQRLLLELAERSCQEGIRAGPFRSDVWVACADVSEKLGLPADGAVRRAAAARL